MKTWSIRVLVEVLHDDAVVGRQREIVGAAVEHVPFDPKYVGSLAGTVGRRVAKNVLAGLPVREGSEPLVR